MREYYGRGTGERFGERHLSDPASGAYGEYGPYGYADYPGAPRYGIGPYGEYGMAFEGERFAGDFEEPWRRRTREHAWRGGVLGWLGAGVRVGAAWFGDRMQHLGSLLGGTLKGGGAGLGRALRGRGERVGAGLEERGEHAMQAYRDRYAPGRFRGRPPRSYRRPDDRILDDLQSRVAMVGVDAVEVEIVVGNGVVTLSGTVPRRLDKRVIEEVAEQVFGVEEVRNHLRLSHEGATTRTEAGVSSGNGHHSEEHHTGGV